ncbi:MAG: DNA gyrase subunit A [Proteobacteria bacterium]|nr:DNA gyrase subunit A [Pseudomonadota bacterium]
MRKSYLDYAMSVIVSRAIPDVRDGLKPVHRRILYAMGESGCDFNKPYRKSARIVGEVMGKYHPHGDSAIYDSLVRMAQDFSLRVTLVDGQGNFGSMDGDSPAAMRYTESRLSKAAHAILNDIDKDTVDWQPNYDGSEKEPIVLPAEFPNLLVNGAGGIAVGMATNIPTHNLGEVIDACCLLIDNPETTIDEIVNVLPGPDFPTGGMILGRTGCYSALHTGRGSVVIRGKAEIQEIRAGREAIVITEIPYQVNKARMIERMAELVREKKIEGISDLRDESDKSGVRVVVELKKDAVGDVVLNQLYKFTPLQSSFGVNMLALNRGQPKLMNIKEVLDAFIDFRQEVITRRTNHLLNKSRDRAHVLIGLAIAVANIDEVIKVIRGAADPNDAREKLLTMDWKADQIAPLIDLVEDGGNVIVGKKCKLTDVQARAILEMKLSRLTGLEMNKIDEEMNGLAVEIKDYLGILGSNVRLMAILKSELLKIKEEFATPRKTVIADGEFEDDIESLIQKEDMVVTVTMGGYIKRLPLSTFRAQKRGGKGRSGMDVREEDVTTDVFVANTHTPMLFFSTKGIAYKLKVYKLPLGSPQSKGRSLMNVFPLGEGEVINQVLALPEDESAWKNLNIMFSTSHGNIRRNKLSDFESVRANGKIAMKLEGDEKLVGVQICSEDQHILLATKEGQAVRCPVKSVRVFKSRDSTGVRGVRLADKDRVISMTILNSSEIDQETKEAYLKVPSKNRRDIYRSAPGADIKALLEGVESTLSHDRIEGLARAEELVLTITENGYGKRSSAYEYRVTNRGGKGITNIVTSERNGKVVASFPVKSGDQIMLITNRGQLIRCPVSDIRIAARNTQGVTIFKIGDGEVVVSAAKIEEGENSKTIDAEGNIVNGIEVADNDNLDAIEEASADADTGNDAEE